MTTRACTWRVSALRGAEVTDEAYRAQARSARYRGRGGAMAGFPLSRQSSDH